MIHEILNRYRVTQIVAGIVATISILLFGLLGIDSLDQINPIKNISSQNILITAYVLWGTLFSVFILETVYLFISLKISKLKKYWK